MNYALPVTALALAAITSISVIWAAHPIRNMRTYGIIVILDVGLLTVAVWSARNGVILPSLGALAGLLLLRWLMPRREGSA
jgi:hypothetical protein